MKAGHSQASKETSHVIYDDGTYSNRATSEEVPVEVKVDKPRPLGGEVFQVPGGGQYMVVGVLDWGIYVYDYPYKYQPRIEDCTFWDWEQYEAEMG